MPVAPKPAARTAIIPSGGGTLVVTSLSNIISGSRDGMFHVGGTGGTDDVTVGGADDIACIIADDTRRHGAIGCTNGTFVDKCHGIDDSSHYHRPAYTAVSSVVAGAAVQSVTFVSHRMRAVYRARGGFASRGSLNPVRPWP